MLMMALLMAVPSVEAKKKLHTIGDSTMDGTYDVTTTDKRGWCMMLQSFFDKENITVNNRGKSGASSKSFYLEAPYWPTLVKGSGAMQEGDYLLIQFAHNDEKTSGTDGDELKAYYTSKGMTAEAAAVDYRGTTAFDTYKQYIRKYINEAKAMGVKPIVVGAICRKYFTSDGKDITRSGRHDLGDKFNLLKDGTLLTDQKVAASDDTYDYIMSAKAVAAEYEDVPFIDLTDLTAKLYVSYGDAYCTQNLFCKDDKTHPAALGATLIARTFAQALKDQYAKETDSKKKEVLKGLADYVIVSNDMTFNPSSGDMGETYVGMNVTKEFNISAFGLAADAGEFTISASEGFKVSTDKKSWNNNVKVSYTGGNLITTVFVRADLTAAGTMTGKLTATDGTNTKELNITASGKSLTGGVESTCVWQLNTTSLAATSETLNGADVKLADMKVSGNPSAPGSPAGHGKMVLFTTTDGSWPAGEIDEVSTRYIEFKATVPEGKTFNLDKVSLDVSGWGGNGMCFKAYYATKSDFTDQVNFAERTKITDKNAFTISADAVKELGEGESVYIRVYPWYNGAATGKYLALSDVTIHGILSDAGGEQITISNAQITWPLGNKATDEVVFSDEKMPLGIQVTDFNMGSEVAKQAAQNWSGTDGITQAMLRFGNPTKTGWSNSSYDAGKAINFTFTPQTGFTFIPTKVSFKACRFGTNGGTIDVKIIGDKEEIIAKADAPTRSSDSKTLTTFVHEVSGIASTEDKPLILSLGLNGLGGEKYLGFADIIIEGTLTGSVQQTVKYNLTTSVSPEGAGTVSVDPVMASYKEGKEVKLSAAKNFGYKFQKWTVDGVDANTTGDLTITMDKDKEVVAVFESVPVYTVTTMCTNDAEKSLGSITITPNENAGKYEAGTEITVVASELPILKFMKWTDEFENAGTTATRKLTVNSDMELVANYEVQDFIAVFNASTVNTYAYENTSNYPFPADIPWDANRNATAQVIRLSDGQKIWTKDGGTPVVRNREGVVLAGINGLYQNGFDTRQIAFQYQFSTKDFTSVTFKADMAAKNMANKDWKVQASTDGTTFTDLTTEGSSWQMTPNVIKPISFTLPESLCGQDLVTLRFVGVGDELLSSSYEVKGQWMDVDYYDHSESGIGNVYVLGEAAVAADEIAPVVTSTIPSNNATGVSATGSITISYDERIQAANLVGGVACLNGKELAATWNSRSVTFQYIGLEYGKTYTFTMPAGYVEDKSGNAADAVELTFTVMDRQKPKARTFNAIVDGSLTEDKIAATEDMPVQYKTIQAAINDAPETNEIPYLIYIKEGYYKDSNTTFNDSYGQIKMNASDTEATRIGGGVTEYDKCYIINVNKPNVHLIGQDVDKVFIATDRLDGMSDDGTKRPWYHIGAGATLEVQAKGTDFFMQGITLDNENWTKLKMAGPQALAANVSADRAVFDNCNFRSYQDTYYNGGDYNRTFINNSTIEGAVDFIYGSSDIWFEGCTLNINRDKGGFIVAPNHSESVRWGYVFNNTTITSTYTSDPSQYSIWLGRPWHNAPKTVFLHTQMELTPYDLLWSETMGGLPALWAVYDFHDKQGRPLSEVSRKTYYKTENGEKIYGDAKNSLTAEEVAEYTVANVMSGDKTSASTGYWNPLAIVEKTEVPEVKVEGNVATWQKDDYAICYVVTVNGKPVAFPTECTYTGNEGDVITVQSVNEYGALSEMSAAATLKSPTGIDNVTEEAAVSTTTSGIFTLDGKIATTKRHGNIYIENGQVVTY